MEKLAPRILIYALGAVLALLFFAGIYLLTGSICPLQGVVGLPCPACGSTRAVILLFLGQFATAHKYMPLVLVSLGFLAYAAVRYTIFRRKPSSKAEKITLLGILMIYLIVYVARMILLFPHTPPMLANENALLRQFLRLISGG